MALSFVRPFSRWLGIGLLQILTLATVAEEKDCVRPGSLLPPSGPRLAVFASDLHLGVGRDPKGSGDWHPMEDFQWDAEWGDFLRHVVESEKPRAADGKSHIDLVLLGDTFELWQSIPSAGARGRDCDHSDIDEGLGCTEDEAVARARHVLDQHADAIEHIGWFAEQGDNHVVIVPGNHDAGLLFEGVRKLVLERITRRGDSALRGRRVRVATEGYWRSADGRVYAEHGHQIGKDPNRFEAWPGKPFIEKTDPATQTKAVYLRRPWGEAFVQDFYNNYEQQFPVIDNLSEEMVGVTYAIAASGVSGTIEALWKAARFLLTQTSWEQTSQLLGRLRCRWMAHRTRSGTSITSGPSIPAQASASGF